MEREAVISGRDLLILAVLVAVGVGLFQIGRRLLFPPPPFARTVVLASSGAGQSGCRAEVWVDGKSGDRLSRLIDYGRRGQRRVTGIVILRPDRSSTPLADSVRTPQGTCQIERYHLVIDGQDAMSLTAAE